MKINFSQMYEGWKNNLFPADDMKTAIKGNISYANIREEFCAKYSSSGPTINNLISKLKRMKIFIKDGSKIKINPIISLAFDNDVVLQITITHG